MTRFYFPYIQQKQHLCQAEVHAQNYNDVQVLNERRSVLVCLSDKNLNITKVRSHIQHIKHLILQSEVDKMLA